MQMLYLTICMCGVQFTWTVELAYGTPYLLSLDLSKDVTALVWLAGPLSAVIGSMSDRCSSRLGRRRPFIIIGGILVCLSMLCVAYAKDIGAVLIWLSDGTDIPENIAEKERRAAIVIAILAFYTLDFSLNAVQASCRALILDVPPLWQQQHANAWAARLSNVAMVVGYFTGFVDLVKFLPFLGDTQIKVFCLVAIAVFIVTVGVTCVTTEEKVFTASEDDDDSRWYSTFVHIWHALRSLPAPIQRLCNVQFFAWLGWFPFLFYSTTWVSDLYFATHSRETPDSWAKGTRAGSFALLLYAIVSVVSGIVLPWLVAHKPCCPALFTMKNVYTAGNLLFSLAMLSTIFVSDVATATLIVAIIGISWSVVLWIPFALVGEYIMVSSATPSMLTPDITSPAASRSIAMVDDDVLSIASSLPSPNYGALVSDIPITLEDESRSIVPEPETSDDYEDELDAGMVLGVHNMYIVFPQFGVAIIAAVIFRVVSWVEHGQNKDENTANVAWVLTFGGVMGLVATLLSRRIVEVTSAPNSRKTTLLQIPTSDRVSV
ncbi:hypothetical protein BJV82DRAFT_644546 [Fennellomyces sp. T-0311]|nr:hypothetical protein BJV82DRAFT_644546 [Fennellomyces sp. T-0311]